MVLQVIGFLVVLVTCAALAVALAAKRQVWRRTPTVDLDASRRWVSLGNVDAAFVQAVAADHSRRRVDS